MKKYLLWLAACFAMNWVSAQATKQEILENLNQTGGVYLAYPSDRIRKETPPPIGYRPFYISHIGRHGSRYLISDADYKNTLNLLEDARKNNALTAVGERALAKMRILWPEVEWRGGDLSTIGVKEQKGIAERMYQHYPEVFAAENSFSACATTVVRCVLSMDAFCERLKELNPTIQIPRNAGMKWQRYLNHHTEKAIAFRVAENTWKPGYTKFVGRHVHPQRLITSLFSDKKFIAGKVDADKLMWSLFAIANGMQNIEVPISFYEFFTKEELFDLWQCGNYKEYVNDGNGALNGGIMMDNAKPLLDNIVRSADSVVQRGLGGADFRFAHDGNLIPLAMLMHLENCYNSISEPNDFYKAWCNFKVAPMAGNIQIVFYRKTVSDQDDVLVKFLLHENEVRLPLVPTDSFPYYRWKDVRAYYGQLLKGKQ